MSIERTTFSRPSIKTQYSDVFKAQALIALRVNNGNVQGTARKLGIPTDTLNDWANNRGVNQAVLEIQDGVKGPIADEFEKASRLYLQRAIDPEAIAKTSGYYALLGAGDAIKSAQLLRGLPTNISEHIDSQELTVILQSVIAGEDQAIDITPDPVT